MQGPISVPANTAFRLAASAEIIRVINSLLRGVLIRRAYPDYRFPSLNRAIAPRSANSAFA